MPIRIPNPQLDAVSRRFGADPLVVSAVRNASLQTGTQFETLLASAAIESGLQPTAQASTSTAKGLFQFTEQTWLGTVRQFGAGSGLASEAASIVQRGGQLTVEDPAALQRILAMRTNPTIAAQMAGAHMRALASQIAAGTGQTPDAGDLYLGHFLGGAGATKMLLSLQNTPTRPAADVLPQAARANQAMFYAKDGTPYTTAQFVANVRERVARAFTDIGSTMPSGPVALTGSTTKGTSPDAPDSGASGWGVATPGNRASTVERSMVALLTEVFTRADSSMPRSQDQSSKRDRTLPQVVVSALQDQPAAVAP